MLWYTKPAAKYPVLSSFVYDQAIAALPTRFADGDVVVMDVDETVLDNSTYQKERESVGLGYSRQKALGWLGKAWRGTLVPGVAAFLDEKLLHEMARWRLLRIAIKHLIVTRGITSWRGLRLPPAIPAWLAALQKIKKR